MSQQTYFVYRLVCFRNALAYVGVTADPHKRENEHFGKLSMQKHYNHRLQNVYNQYGKDAFYFEILEKGISKADKSEREHYWISHFDSFNNGFNLNPGGFGLKGTGKKCKWNGIEYNSYVDAALVNGVANSTMRRWVLKGYTCDADVPPELKQCTWNGISHQSLLDAAKANNISPSRMSVRLSNGWTCDADMPGKLKPTVWNGIEYPSIRSAAKALGIHDVTMIYRLRKGYASDNDLQRKKQLNASFAKL